MSLRVPGSTLDERHPTAVVDDRYFLGSGSSQSAAVVSGYAAALLSRDPSLTPDQVKYLFTLKAKDLKEVPATIDGAGKIQPKDTARSTGKADAAPIQSWIPAIGSSSQDSTSTSGGSWSGGSWSGGSWSGGSWSGGSWSGGSWSGGSWSGASWSGGSWSGASWSGGSWSGGSWSGNEWAGVDWSTHDLD